MGNKKNIVVDFEVSRTDGRFYYSPEDLGYTQEQWDNLSESEKRDVLIDALDNESQPYFRIISFTE